MRWSNSTSASASTGYARWTPADYQRPIARGAQQNDARDHLMSPTMLKLSLSKNVALTVLLYREQRVAVGRRAHDGFGCQIRARARPVLDYNRLPEPLGEPLRDQARGCGVLQVNGQPTAQNTRETGADGDLPGFRNWANEEHIKELARLWNVDASTIPHWAPPTHALQIFRYCETGSIRLLWISATNPAVSLPNLARGPKRTSISIVDL
jgi:hypothetical protein